MKHPHRSLVYICILLISCMHTPTGWCQHTDAIESLRLSLAEAIDMAIDSSENVRQRQNDVTTSEYRHTQALSSALPHINADAGYNYYPKVQSMEVAAVPGAAPISMELGKKFDFATAVTLEQTVFTFGKIKNAIRAAVHGKSMSRFGLEASTREMAYTTAKAYITVLLAQKVVAIAKGSYQNAAKNKQILDERFSYGRIPKSDGIKSMADIAARVPALKEAESDLDLARRYLKRLIGIPNEQMIVLIDPLTQHFPQYDVDTALDDMLDIEPRLKLLSSTIDFHAALAKKERSQYFPTIGAYANYTLFGQSNHAYIGKSAFQNLGTIGLNVSIPLWNGNRTWAIYKQALLSKANSELQLQKAQRDLTLELRNAISEYDHMRETYRANREAVRLSQESLEAQQDVFRTGGKSLLDLNDAELQLTRNKLNAALTLYTINDTIARIERLISGTGEKSWRNRHNR